MEKTESNFQNVQKKSSNSKKQMYKKLCAQMEFYFSPSNLTKDRFMAKLISENTFIPLKDFLAFNKIKEIFNSASVSEEKQLNELKKAISKSKTLLYSEDDTVKLKEPAQMKSKEEIDNCTIYVEQIPLNSTHDSLRTIFSKYGKVNYISLPRYKKSRQLKHFCFVEFDDAASIAKVIAAFKKFDAVLHCSSTKPENLQSIVTFDKEESGDEDGEPPAKKICVESAEEKDKSDTEKDPEEEPSEADKEPSKKKRIRKHKRKASSFDYSHEGVLSMRVMRKNDWKKMRNAYLNLERQKAKEIKKILRESDIKRSTKVQEITKLSPTQKINFYASPNRDENVSCDQSSEKKDGEQTKVPRCFVQISFKEPCTDIKEMRKEFKQFSYVKSVNFNEGESQCIIRVDSHQSAQNLINHYSSCEYSTQILSDCDGDVWKKEKMKKRRTRGRERLANKVAKAVSQHIRFNDFEEGSELKI